MKRQRLSWLRLLVFPLLAWSVWLPGRAQADGSPRVTIVEENDSLYFDTDQHYTQGLRLSYLTPELQRGALADRVFDVVGRVVPPFARGDGGTDVRRLALVVGQSLFTPKNLTVIVPDPHDRPYAGWLHGGVSLLQEHDRRVLDDLEVDVGVVGPAAWGKETQNDWHQFIGARQARGWRNQIRDEPALTVSYERFWRLPVLEGAEGGIDLVPQVGATVGNVFTYGEAGALLRVGTTLGADYGPVRIRPGLSGSDYFDGDRAAGRLGFYVFAGVQGRVVGRNIFLDGNSFRDSASVGKRTLVADWQAGLSLFFGRTFRLDVSAVHRTEEFVGQRHPDEFGTATFSFSW